MFFSLDPSSPELPHTLCHGAEAAVLGCLSVVRPSSLRLPPIYLSIYLFVYLSIVYLSIICLIICLSLYLSI